MLDIGLKDKFITTQEYIIKTHYSLSLCIHSKWGKIWTRKTLYLGAFYVVL